MPIFAANCTTIPWHAQESRPPEESRPTKWRAKILHKFFPMLGFTATTYFEGVCKLSSIRHHAGASRANALGQEPNRSYWGNYLGRVSTLETFSRILVLTTLDPLHQEWVHPQACLHKVPCSRLRIALREGGTFGTGYRTQNILLHSYPP